MNITTSKTYLSSMASSILDNAAYYCTQNKLDLSHQNLAPLIDDSMRTLKELICQQLNERFPKAKSYVSKHVISNYSIHSFNDELNGKEDVVFTNKDIYSPMYIFQEGDKCDQEFNSKEIRYIIPFKCKIFSSTLRLPLLRFGDRLLLSQPIADIKNLYLLCACVNKNGQIIGPILHKDQDLFRKNLKTHESGLVSYELRTEKEFRSERDKLSSFGPIIRTRNGLPFDRDSPAGTDPVFFWILEKHSDKVWGSTQMFVVGCKKSTFFKDYMSPSSEQMIKRRMIPLPLISIDNMLPTNLLTECKRKKRSSITGTTLNMHPPNKITKISDSSSNFMYNEPYSQSSYSEGVSSNYSNDYQYCEQNFIQPNYSNFLAQQQFYPEIRDSFANDILYGLSPFDDYMMAG